MNARTLETQISRLLSSQYQETRSLGHLLKQAANEPAFNVQSEWLRGLVAEIKEANPELGARAEQQLLRPVKVAPTLVKYANICDYEITTRKELAAAAAELMAGRRSRSRLWLTWWKTVPLKLSWRPLSFIRPAIIRIARCVSAWGRSVRAAAG